MYFYCLVIASESEYLEFLCTRSSFSKKNDYLMYSVGKRRILLNNLLSLLSIQNTSAKEIYWY